MSALLAVEGIDASYGGRPVLDGVSFAVDEGEALGVVGASGSGKTTLARVIAGLLRPTTGYVRWQGEDIARLRPVERRRRGASIAMVFQDPQSSLDPRLAVWDAVSEPLAITGAPRRARRDEAARLLSLVSLDSDLLDRRPHALSGGQRQRVAIARALCQSPKLIVLDEPTSALDVTVQATVLDLLARLRRELGVAYLFVTHDLHVMRRTCDRVLVMEGGRVVESGPARTISDAPEHPYTRRLIAATPSVRERIDLTRFIARTDAEQD